MRAKDCSHIKYIDELAPSGLYTIRPATDSACTAPVQVYCDMSEIIGWTKILQITGLYTPTANAFGTIAEGHNFSATAKLSDKMINEIRINLEKWGVPGEVYYRLTAANFSERVYAKTNGSKPFNDSKTAWQIFEGYREQCSMSRLRSCWGNFLLVNFKTLDTMYDGTGSGEREMTRFFTDVFGNGPSCYGRSKKKRCVQRGHSYKYAIHQYAELWIGK